VRALQVAPSTVPVLAESSDAGLAVLRRNGELMAALEAAQDLGDVVHIGAEASALAGLARAAHLGLEQQNELAATRIRVQHRAGTLLRQMAAEYRPGRATRARGRTPLRPRLPDGVLAKHGVSGLESSLWQSIASLPIDDIEQRIGELIAVGQEVTSAEFYRHGRASLRKRSSRSGASPTELRLRAVLSNLARIRALSTAVEAELARRIVGKLRELGIVLEPVRADLTTVVAMCLLCGREREHSSDRRCTCGASAWTAALR